MGVVHISKDLGPGWFKDRSKRELKAISMASWKVLTCLSKFRASVSPIPRQPYRALGWATLEPKSLTVDANFMLATNINSVWRSTGSIPEFRQVRRTSGTAPPIQFGIPAECAGLLGGICAVYTPANIVQAYLSFGHFYTFN